MTTLNDLITDVKLKLSAYTLNQDKITYMSGSLSTSATTLVIGSSDNLAKGIIEIDDELLHVDSYTEASLTLNVSPGFGRGYMGTTAAAHNANSMVTLAPTFPRNMIKQAINDTIRAVYPKLYKVATTTFTASSAVSTFELPAACETVLTASWQSPGPSAEWYTIRRFRVDSMANTTTFTSGNTITFNSAILTGRTIQVAYTAQPTALSANTDDFTTVSGLPASCVDIIVLGACHRLLAFIDAGRLNFVSAESDAADSKQPSYAGQSIAKYVLALYTQRLNDEANRMLGQYKATLRYSS
jgi:hypothetical protein